MHTHTYHGHDMHHSSSDKVRGYTDESLTSSSSSTLRRSTSPPPPPTPVRVQTRPATVRERVRRVANLAVVGMPAWLVFLFVVMELLTVAWVVRSKMGSESPSPKFARAAAIASLIHLGAVMFPATRRSVMLHVFRVPFQHALIMHRLLGTVSLAWVLAHGIAMAVEYGFEAMLSLESPTGRPHPPLYGFLAGIGFLIVLSFAVPWVRRAKFELFYYVHHTLVIPVVFAVLHVRTLVLYGAPAVMLYLLDRVLRFVRGRTPIVVCRARHVVCGEFNYVRLDLDATTTRSRGDWRAGSYAFAKISSASHLQWHPVSPFPTSAADDQCPRISLLFKVQPSESAWTRAVAELAGPGHPDPEEGGGASETGTGSIKTTHLDGPYGGHAHAVSSPVSILVAGGVGITPMLSYLAAVRRNRSLPVAVLLIWCVRSPGLVALVRDELIAALEDDRVRLRICVTGRQLGPLSESRYLGGLHNVVTPGRPDFSEVTHTYLTQEIVVEPRPQGMLAAVICGPTTLAASARKAILTKARPLGWNVEVREEVFEL